MTDRPIHTAIRLPPAGIAIDFGPMCPTTCRRVESFVAKAKRLAGRGSTRARFEAMRKAKNGTA